VEGADVPDVWRTEFLLLRSVPGRGICGVQRFVFTCGLLTNLRFDGLCYDYDARYCYPLAMEALVSLAAWDGVGDPRGAWIKEKVSGRPNTAPDAV
jgi:hypothetical protein